jgi:hypothetical protein
VVSFFVGEIVLSRLLFKGISAIGHSEKSSSMF